MMDYINTHLAGFWIAVGFFLLILEVLIFGFSAIIFLFMGIGALVTGLLLNLSLLPETWAAAIASFGMITGLSAVLLWAPFKRMQNKSPRTKNRSSDFIGLNFTLEQDLSTTQTASHTYSGIRWKLELDDSSEQKALEKGERVEVVFVDVGVFRVKKLSV